MISELQKTLKEYQNLTTRLRKIRELLPCDEGLDIQLNYFHSYLTSSMPFDEKIDLKLKDIKPTLQEIYDKGVKRLDELFLKIANQAIENIKK